MCIADCMLLSLCGRLYVICIVDCMLLSIRCRLHPVAHGSQRQTDAVGGKCLNTCPVSFLLMVTVLQN